jgi:hypothetical protein
MKKTLITALLWSLVSAAAWAGATREGTSQKFPEPSLVVLDPAPPKAGEQLITFSEFPRDTQISNQYVSKGILFGGDSPFITSDRSNPTSPVLSGEPQFFGAIEGSFVKTGNADQPGAVNSFSLDAGYFDHSQSVRISLYDAQGRLIRRATNANLGVRTFTFNEYGVSRWRIEAFDDEPAGFAIDNVRLPRPYRAIFAGITGAEESGDVEDDPDNVVQVRKNQEIADHVRSTVNFCRTNTCLPRDESHLTKIGASGQGGVVALGFFMTSIAGASSLNTPGNSEIPKTFIVDNYKPGDKVYVVGFSAGGGDAQNLLLKLDRLNIPVELSGHIDSVELFGEDATIPDNTRIAKGYYQTQSNFLFRGENKLTAAKPSVTTVTNTKITNPVGPANPQNDSVAHHRNMDNDPRVWNNLRTAIIASLKKSAGGAAQGEAGDARCPECREPGASHSMVDWVADLKAALAAQASTEELYSLREQMAQSVSDAVAYRALLAAHGEASGDPTLQENLTAVTLKVSPARFLAEAEAAAAQVIDYPLFVAMLHSLARVDDREAQKAVVRLIAANRLEVSPGRLADAAVGAYSERGREPGEDAGWMLEWVRGEALSDLQLFAIARIMTNAAAQPEVRPLLNELAQQIREERLKVKVMALQGN